MTEMIIVTMELLLPILFWSAFLYLADKKMSGHIKEYERLFSDLEKELT